MDNSNSQTVNGRGEKKERREREAILLVHLGNCDMGMGFVG